MSTRTDYFVPPVPPDVCIDLLKARITVLERELAEARASRKFYKRRCDMLQREQKNFRDPERIMVCDILANAQLLPDPNGDRYGKARNTPTGGEVGA